MDKQTIEKIIEDELNWIKLKNPVLCTTCKNRLYNIVKSVVEHIEEQPHETN